MSHARPHVSYKETKIPWLSKIPSHWNCLPLLAVADECDDKNIGLKENNLLSLSYGRIVKKDINSDQGLLPESFETYQIIEQDDIVFRMTDLQNDQRSLRSAISLERGIITSAYIAVRPRGINPSFMSYLMRAYDVTKVFYAMGGGMRQSLKFEDLRRLQIVVPPLDEQDAICHFLDRETFRVDALIAKKTRFIELLKEKRQSMIAHAVTKGLDTDIPMRDSGEEWIGEVPEHWTAMKFKHVARVTEGLVDPKEQQYCNMVLVAPNHIESGTGKVLGLETAANQNAESGKYACKKGVVIYSKIRPALAKVAIAPCDCLCSADMYPMDCTNHALPKWLFYLMLSPPFTSWAVLESDRVAMPKINRESLAGLKVFVPPIDEQKTVVAWLDAQFERIDQISSKTQRSIELLREHRSALIAAAATGKIDVREAA